MSNSFSAELVALIAVGLLGLVLRWVFRPSRPRTGRLTDAADAGELGLLSVIASNLTRLEAMGHRARLGEVGIRSSMSRRRDGTMDLLVFHGDVDRARTILSL